MPRFLSLSFAALLVASIAVTSSGSATQAEARWVITDLGALGRRASEAVAINERGQIVGAVDTARFGEEIFHAFLWQKGKMRDLGTLGERESYAYGINKRGQISGWVRTGSKVQAFLWQAGTMRTFGLRDLADSAVVINDRGQLAGTSEEAFVWQSGRSRYLGTLGAGAASWASAINGRGQVVGRATIGAHSEDGGEIYHAFLWQSGKMRDLGTFGGAWSEAYGINEGVQVVGQADTKAKDKASKYNDPIYHAFLWQSGKMRDLSPAGRYSAAYGVNDRGQVVGYVRELGENRDERAVLWKKGQTIWLPTHGGRGGAAMAINNRNQIVGWEYGTDLEKHAVVWTLKRG